MKLQWYQAWMLLIVIGIVSVWGENVQAWCWIRDTGSSQCGTTETYQQSCCSGNLQKWIAGGMTYQISNAVADINILAAIRTGMSRWNEVTMSTFTFTEGARTDKDTYANDNVNIVNIDPKFCTKEGCCGQGILGGSSCFTTTAGGYQVIDCDIVLNGEEFSWGNNVETIATVTHEAGHDAGLTHPGSTCQSSGSEGCGPDFEHANMYYISQGQSSDLSTLELDDVASLVYGYPRSTFRVQVMQGETAVSGATVTLIGTSAPVNGTDIVTGGKVYGDVSTVYRFGDKVDSDTYVAQTPFSPTDASGYTNYINPVHQSFKVRVTKNSTTVTKDVTISDGTSTLTVDIGSSNSYLLWTK